MNNSKTVLNARLIRKLGALNVSRSKAKGPAPNKPLLDLAESGLIGA